MTTAIMIFQIFMILWKAEPELAKVWLGIMQVVKPTPEAGNADSQALAKSSLKAIMPVLTADDQAKIDAILAEAHAYDGGGA